MLTIVTQANLLFERLSVLYNIGALYSQLATSQSRTTGESLKRACQYFQQAAGAFEYLSQNTGDLRLPPGMSVEDFSEPTVNSLKFLMLAQAQECFWQKSVLGTYPSSSHFPDFQDQMKDSLISKLSAQVSEFYDQALSSAMASTNIPSDWITHITAKKLHFYSAAQYRKSKDAAAGTGANKYGEELARLQEALRNVNKALERKNFLSRGVREDLLGLQEILQRDTERAEKDNDLIYLSN
jgi:programmed cell death 6-interacting protein